MSRQSSQPPDHRHAGAPSEKSASGSADGATTVSPSRVSAPSVVPLKDRLFAHLAVVDEHVSVSKARRALEKLVLNALSDEPDTRPSARRILVEAGALTPEQATEIRRVREGLLLECWHCFTLYWLEPFDPLYPHRCKRCGDDLAWPSRPPAPSLSDSATRSFEADDVRQARDSSASDTGNVAELMRRRDTTSTFRPPTVSQVARDYAESALGEKEEHAARLELELIGRRMGSFLVRQLVGRGGMGSVYEAYDPATKQIAAIKVMMPMAASALDYVWRFKREAELSSKMRHPNLVEVWEFGEFGPWLYLTMPFVEGKTLQQILHERGKPLPIERTVHHIADALDGVHAAHEIGILHRDLKPDNLLVTPEGRVRVLDFGLARAQLDDRITQVGQTVGTPRFMSPEQWRDQAVGPQADVHSLGISLYYLLTGRFPYPDADTPLGAYHSMMDNMPVPLRQYRPDVSAELEATVHRMMAKDARRRPTTAQEAAQALREVVVPLAKLRDEPLTGASHGTQVTELGEAVAGKGKPSRKRSTRRTTPPAAATKAQPSKETSTRKRRVDSATPAVLDNNQVLSGDTTLDQPLRATVRTPGSGRAAPTYAQLRWRRHALYAVSFAAVVLLVVLLALIATGTFFGARSAAETNEHGGGGGGNDNDNAGASADDNDNDNDNDVQSERETRHELAAGRPVHDFATVGNPSRVLALDRGRIRASGPLLVLPELPLTAQNEGEVVLHVQVHQRESHEGAPVYLGLLELDRLEDHEEVPAPLLELAAPMIEQGNGAYVTLTLTPRLALLTVAPSREELSESAPAVFAQIQGESADAAASAAVAVRIPEGVTLELSQWSYHPRAGAEDNDNNDE